MTALALTTYQSKGGPLSTQDIDGNWAAIANAFNALMTAILPVLTFQQSADLKSVTVLVSGNSAGTFPLPASPLNDRGAYLSGTTYAQGDFVYSGGSSYRCPVAAGFKSTTR